MTSGSGKVRPPERAVGARVRVKAAHGRDAETLFIQAGFPPIHEEPRTDGTVSYWFGKGQTVELLASGVLERLPLSWWAGYAIAGSPPTID